MKDAVELFAALGSRLRRFGSEARDQEVTERACLANAWFTPAEVRRAVGAIAEEMLQPGRLAEWLARYPALPVPSPQRVEVIMAGNIPLVGFFDLLCVVASGHRCAVKPSAKDRILTEYVIGLLHEIDPETPVTLAGREEEADAVIATGGANANRHFRARYAGIPALLRGHRQSVAVLSGRESEAQLRGLADDIWAYSGLGCRNVSLLFLPAGYEPMLEMPPMNPKFTNNYRCEKALLTMTGQPFTDLGSAVLVEQECFPSALSRVAAARYESLAEVEAWLAAHDEEVQCVVSECMPHSRRIGFGRAQSPGLADYADERDTMAWLAAIARSANDIR